jgi:hypothetical protein
MVTGHKSGVLLLTIFGLKRRLGNDRFTFMSGLCVGGSALLRGGAKRNAFAAVRRGQMPEPRQRRDHKPGALLDLPAPCAKWRVIAKGSAPVVNALVISLGLPLRPH